MIVIILYTIIIRKYLNIIHLIYIHIKIKLPLVHCNHIYSIEYMFFYLYLIYLFNKDIVI